MLRVNIFTENGHEMENESFYSNQHPHSQLCQLILPIAFIQINYPCRNNNFTIRLNFKANRLQMSKDVKFIHGYK